MIITILILGIALFIAFGLYNASKLTKIQLVNSITVNTTQQQAFDRVRNLSEFPKWSPFLQQDPSQQYEVKGVDGQVGAQYHWLGNGGKDLGYQEIVKIDSPNYIGMRCDIQKPFIAQPTFEYRFTKTTNGVIIEQDFRVDSPLAGAFFMWLFGAKKEMDKTNKLGLELLKKSLESR